MTRRGNLGGNGRSLDAEPVTPQTLRTPDFKLTIEDMLAPDFDPAALRALFGETHCKNISRLLIEAGVSTPTLSQLRERLQLASRPISA